MSTLAVICLSCVCFITKGQFSACLHSSFLSCLLVPISLSFRQASALEMSIFSPWFKREKVHLFSSSLIDMNICVCFSLLPLACRLCPLFCCPCPRAAPIIRVTDVGAAWTMGPFLHFSFFPAELYTDTLLSEHAKPAHTGGSQMHPHVHALMQVQLPPC